MSYNASAQQDCPEKITYEVSKLIIEGQSIALAQYYYFQKDSLRVVDKNKDVTKPFSDDLVFYIVEKNCKCNTGLTEGKSDYKLVIKTDDELTEYPTLKIEIKDKKGQMILQYPGEKQRIFEVVII